MTVISSSFLLLVGTEFYLVGVGGELPPPNILWNNDTIN